MNEHINEYLQNQLGRAKAFLDIYTKDNSGSAYEPRYLFHRLKKRVDDFIGGETEIRIFGMPGLRGVGKTTLVAQLYQYLLSKYPNNLLYISGDQITDLLQSDLHTVLSHYEKILGTPFESLSSPHFIFIDEIHYDSKWPHVLKWLYDKSRNIFVICTGSSALSLQSSSTDLARRIIFETLSPMKFTEYLFLKNKKTNINLGQTISDALLYSNNVDFCYAELDKISKEVSQYWQGLDRMEIDRHLRFTTMPFVLHEKNEELFSILTNEIINKVIERDLPEINKFKQNTLSMAKHILLMTASSNEVSFGSLSKNLTGISIVTLMDLFETFEKAELLTRAYPYGSTFKKVRKPSKYLFKSPALRYSLLESIEGKNAFQKYIGKYLEDIIAMYITQDIKLSNTLFYDASKGGADFIISLGSNNIIIEAGIGKKGVKQVVQTIKKYSGKYGVVIAQDKLELLKDDNIIKIPLEMFLMM